jgi:hypothetical protein
LAAADRRAVPEVHWLMIRATELNVQVSMPQLLGRQLLSQGNRAGQPLGSQLAQAFEAQSGGAICR